MAKRSKRLSSQGEVAGLSELQAKAKLQRVRWLITEGDTVAAVPLLREVAAKTVRSRPVLSHILELAMEVEDLDLFEWVAMAYLERWSLEADQLMACAQVCAANGHFARTVSLFRKVVQQWPAEVAAEDARESLSRLEPELATTLSEVGLAKDDFAGALEHERIQSLMAVGAFGEAAVACGQLLSTNPSFVPASNNYALCLWTEGRLEESLQVSEHALVLQPDNVHALCNSIRVLVLRGRREEADMLVRRLIASKLPGWERNLKVAEGLAWMGMHAELVELWKSVGHEEPVRAESAAMIRHLVAAAAANLGDRELADRLWREAVRAQPDGELFAENLDDLRAAPEARHGPWFFPLYSIVPPAWLRALGEATEKKGEGPRKLIGELLGDPTKLVALLRLLFELGGPEAARFGIGLAGLSGEHSAVAEVRAFVQGRRGSDALRLEALPMLGPPGEGSDEVPLRMSISGQDRELRRMSFEVYDEPDTLYPDAIMPLADEAHRAIGKGNFRKAERLFRQALALAPGTPAVEQNLAVALSALGREEESMRIVRDLHRRRPDYFFARCALAGDHARQGRVAEAEVLLAPLATQQRFHRTELIAYARTQVVLATARRDLRSVEQWLGILKEQGDA